MKYSNYCILFAIIILLTGCISTTKQNIPITIEVTREVTRFTGLVTVQVTKEVTRIVEIRPTVMASITPTPTSTATPSLTRTPSITRKPSCYDTALTQFEINQCAGENMETQKALLKSLIINLKYRMASKEYASLLLVQAKWESFVEDHCRWAESFFEGGSISPAEYAQCIADQYVQRINVLRYYLCEVGGPPDCEASLRYKQ